MTNEFTRLGLYLKLAQAVTDPDYTTPAPVQSKIIPLMPAGAGKYRIRKNAVTLELA